MYYEGIDKTAEARQMGLNKKTLSTDLDEYVERLKALMEKEEHLLDIDEVICWIEAQICLMESGRGIENILLYRGRL